MINQNALGLMLLMAATCALAQADVTQPIYRNDGKVVTERSRVGGDVSTYETGLVNGVFYRVYPSDLSGSFGGTPEFDGVLNASNINTYLGDHWSIGCHVDAMTDKKTCSISRKDFSLYVEKSSVQVIVGSDHYPGRPASIRIGKNKPFTTSNDGQFTKAISRQIAAQMLAGQNIATRYIEWPYNSYKDDSFPAFGFKEALDYAKWAVAQP